MLVPTVSFWLLNALFLIADATGKPSFITRYRIQQDKNNPVGSAPAAQPVRRQWDNHLEDFRKGY